METTRPISTTEILDEVIGPLDPSFAREFSQMVLKLRLSDTARQRIGELLRRNNAGMLEAPEKADLENYLLVGQFLDLLQAKARAGLERRAPSP